MGTFWLRAVMLLTVKTVLICWRNEIEGTEESLVILAWYSDGANAPYASLKRFSGYIPPAEDLREDPETALGNIFYPCWPRNTLWSIRLICSVLPKRAMSMFASFTCYPSDSISNSRKTRDGSCTSSVVWSLIAYVKKLGLGKLTNKEGLIFCCFQVKWNEVTEHMWKRP